MFSLRRLFSRKNQNLVADAAIEKSDIAGSSRPETKKATVVEVKTAEPAKGDTKVANAAAAKAKVTKTRTPKKSPRKVKKTTTAAEKVSSSELNDDAIIAAVQDETTTIAAESNESAPAKSIWDVEEDLLGISEPIVAPTPAAAPAPTGGRRRTGRVKTRLLGAEESNAATSNADLFSENNRNDPSKQAVPLRAKFPVGWIVVTDGPGRGESFSLLSGMSQIGRGTDQEVQLDFGDTSISRTNHAAIAYDPEERTFFLGHGGKSNLVRLNAKPVLSTELITTNDLIKIGETTLRFIAFCDATFDWSTNDIKDDDDTAIA